jgi:hypothetical protein
MKHKILFAFVLTAAALSTHAQKVTFDLLINQVNSYMAYRGVHQNLNHYRQNYAGLQAGISLETTIGPECSIVNELYWATKGSVLKEGNTLTTGKSSLRISTIELPVLARIHFGNLYVNAGPYGSYLLSGRIKTEAYGSTAAAQTKLAFNNSSFNRWEAGLQAGAGYAFNLVRTILTVDFRYAYGLTSLSSDIERYNRTYIIGVRISRPSRK